VFLEARSRFPKELEEGHTVEGHALPAGCNPDAPQDLLYTVTELYPEHVVLDGNHPLAGIAIRIHLDVQSVREATQDEQERGITIKAQTAALSYKSKDGKIWNVASNF
jgi:FKBP-type peptidyl-prolyl cis-trans isomerase SlyD